MSTYTARKWIEIKTGDMLIHTYETGYPKKETKVKTFVVTDIKMNKDYEEVLVCYDIVTMETHEKMKNAVEKKACFYPRLARPIDFNYKAYEVIRS